jgi:hypothetical protein
VLEPGGETDLAEKALSAQAGGDLRVQHLERHRPIVLEILRQVDRGHAAATELPLNPVSIGQGGRQLVHSVGQQESPARGAGTMLRSRCSPR